MSGNKFLLFSVRIDSYQQLFAGKPGTCLVLKIYFCTQTHVDKKETVPWHMVPCICKTGVAICALLSFTYFHVLSMSFLIIWVDEIPLVDNDGMSIYSLLDGQK